MLYYHISTKNNKYDSNNIIIDKIVKEKDENKKKKLIEYLRILETIDFSSSEYEFQFFTTFNNNKLFFFKDNKKQLKRLKNC